MGIVQALTGEATQKLGKSALSQLVSFGERTLRSGRDILSHTEAGTKLAGMMDEVWKKATLRAAADETRVHNILQGMGKEEVSHVSDVMEGLVQPRSPRHSMAANQLHSIMEEYGDDAMDAELKTYSGLAYQRSYDKYIGKSVQSMENGMPVQKTINHSMAARLASKEAARPFMPMPDYVPHYFDEASISTYMKPGPLRERALRAIMDAGWSTDKKTSERYLERMLRQPAEFRGGPLQHTRDFNLMGYSKDLRTTLPRYFNTSANRIETARTFGNRDQIAKELINGIAKESPERAAMANNLYLAFARNQDPKYKDLARATSMVHTVTLLSTAGIIQPSQMINTVSRYGWVSTVKASSEIFQDWAKYMVTGKESPSEAFARGAGVLMDTIRADLQLDTINDIPQMWMKIIGLEQLDSLNRVVSANAGRIYANEIARKLATGKLKGRPLEYAMHELKQLGIDGGAVLERGTLIPDEVRTAGLMASTNTQFASRALDLPEMRATPAGRFLYLYKSYSFQQYQFIKSMILEADKTNNFGPLIRWTVTLPLGAVTIGEAIRTLKGRKVPKDVDPEHLPIKRLFEDIAIAGSTGMFYDMWRAMANGPSAVMSWAMGPTAGEAAQVLGSDIPSLVTPIVSGKPPNFTPIFKHMVRRVPLIGPSIHNAWWPD